MHKTVTLELLKAISPKTKEATLELYVDPINKLGQDIELFSNAKRIAAFLAQIAHESGGFIFVKENLNYGAK